MFRAAHGLPPLVRREARLIPRLRAEQIRRTAAWGRAVRGGGDGDGHRVESDDGHGGPRGLRVVRPQFVLVRQAT